MSLTKTQALRRASLHVSLPHKSIGGQYLVYKPSKMTSPNGVGSEPFKAYCRKVAFQQRANYVASIALHLMGYSGEDYKTGSDCIDYDSSYTAALEGFIPAKDLLNLAIIAINESKENNES